VTLTKQEKKAMETYASTAIQAEKEIRELADQYLEII
jgi:hypothetical protein